MTRSPQRWVLLHGAPLNPSAWDGVRAHLDAEVLAPDISRHVAHASSSLWQTELATMVLSDITGDDLVLVGHSLGGQVAMEMALLAPQRIRQLVLVCTRDTPVPGFRDVANRLLMGAPVDVDAGLQRWFTPAELSARGTVVRYAEAQLEGTATATYAAALDALSRYERREQVGAISVPAQLICGRLDQGCTPAVMETLASDLPHSALHIVDSWAHMSPFVHPVAFAELLTRLSGR